MQISDPDPPGRDLPATLSPATALGVRAFHRQLPGYRPTPLVRLERLVRAWGFKDIFVKDEAPRFGLKAFKVLGGSYAVARLVCQKLRLPLSKVPYARLVNDDVRERIGQITLATATDGNHGRGVAWAAERLDQKKECLKNPSLGLSGLSLIILRQNIFATKTLKHKDKFKQTVLLCVFVPLWPFYRFIRGGRI